MDQVDQDPTAYLSDQTLEHQLWEAECENDFRLVHLDERIFFANEVSFENRGCH